MSGHSCMVCGVVRPSPGDSCQCDQQVENCSTAVSMLRICWETCRGERLQAAVTTGQSVFQEDCRHMPCLKLHYPAEQGCASVWAR